MEVILDFKVFLEELCRYINNLGEKLDLSNLDQVIFTDNFVNDVTEFQKEYNLDIGVTDNELGSAWGKALPKGKSPHEYVIFLKSEIAHSILFNSPDKDFLLNLIQHELAHVHDHKANNEFNKKMEIEIDIKIHNTYILWMEYVANRLCALTLPTEYNYNLGNILFYYNNMKSTVNKLVEDYLEIKDRKKFVSLMQPLMHQFLVACYSSLGFLDEVITDDNDKKDIINEVLIDIQQKEVLYELDSELMKLYDLYPFTGETSILNHLSDLSYTCWRIFGLDFQ